MGLLNAFDGWLMPLAMEAGTCLFKITLISGIYVLIRANAHQGIVKIKTASIGYVLLKSINSYIALIDKICNNMKF